MEVWKNQNYVTLGYATISLWQTLKIIKFGSKKLISVSFGRQPLSQNKTLNQLPQNNTCEKLHFYKTNFDVILRKIKF